MADLNKFKRSKERITEILSTYKNVKDDKTSQYITNLQKSLQIIDIKIEEFQQKKMA